MAKALSNPEVEHDRDEHIDRGARKASRVESPSGYCRDSFFIEAAAIQRPDDPDSRWTSVTGDDDFQHDRALDSVSKRLVRVTRLDFFDQARRGYRTARAVNASASSASGSGPESRAISRAHTSSDARTNAAARPWTCRRARQRSTGWQSDLLEDAGGQRPGIEHDRWGRNDVFDGG